MCVCVCVCVCVCMYISGILFKLALPTSKRHTVRHCTMPRMPTLIQAASPLTCHP